MPHESTSGPPPPAADLAPKEPGPTGPLSRQLAHLAAEFTDRPVRFGELFDVLQLRGYNATLLFLAIPFVTPIPMPGLSAPFGLTIAVLGLRMALAQKPWVPEFIRVRSLPAQFVPKLLQTVSRIFGRLEKLLKPRLYYPEYPAAFQRVSGLIVLLCGLLLLLPLPVPFSNGFPALAVVLLAAAGLERDGAVFLAGCLQFAFSLGFFGALILGGSEAWHRWLH